MSPPTGLEWEVQSIVFHQNEPPFIGAFLSAILNEVSHNILFVLWPTSIWDQPLLFNALFPAFTLWYTAPRVHSVRTAVSGPPVFRTRRSRLLWEALWHGEGINPLLAAAPRCLPTSCLAKVLHIRLIITSGDRPKMTRTRLMSLWCELISGLEYDWQAAVLTNVCLALALFAAFCVC